MTSRKSELEIYDASKVVLVLAACLILLMLLRTYVLTSLWQWYVVTGFGVAPLRMPVAYGLAVIVSTLIPLPSADKGEDFAKSFIKLIAVPVVGLLFGYIGSLFM